MIVITENVGDLVELNRGINTNQEQQDIFGKPYNVSLIKAERVYWFAARV